MTRLALIQALSGGLAGTMLVCLTMPDGSAGPGREQPPPPTSPPTRYDPDLTTCEPERIRRGFRQQLQSYADQSDAVISQLRVLQLELTRNSLRRCVARDLLTRPQADQLIKELSSSPTRP